MINYNDYESRDFIEDLKGRFGDKKSILTAAGSNTRKYCWTGTITTTAGKTYEFENKDIVQGSGYITRECCGSSEIELGTVYAAEMGITLFSSIDRYTLDEAEVRIYYHLTLADGSEESILSEAATTTTLRPTICISARRQAPPPRREQLCL